jgi:hypothetical protein
MEWFQWSYKACMVSFSLRTGKKGLVSHRFMHFTQLLAKVRVASKAIPPDTMQAPRGRGDIAPHFLPHH